MRPPTGGGALWRTASSHSPWEAYRVARERFLAPNERLVRTGARASESKKNRRRERASKREGERGMGREYLLFTVQNVDGLLRGPLATRVPRSGAGRELSRYVSVDFHPALYEAAINVSFAARKLRY